MARTKKAPVNVPHEVLTAVVVPRETLDALVEHTARFLEQVHNPVHLKSTREFLADAVVLLHEWQHMSQENSGLSQKPGSKKQ